MLDGLIGCFYSTKKQVRYNGYVEKTLSINFV